MSKDPEEQGCMLAAGVIIFSLIAAFVGIPAAFIYWLLR